MPPLYTSSLPPFVYFLALKMCHPSLSLPPERKKDIEHLLNSCNGI